MFVLVGGGAAVISVKGAKHGRRLSHAERELQGRIRAGDKGASRMGPTASAFVWYGFALAAALIFAFL